jgi:hypothetical protein
MLATRQTPQRLMPAALGAVRRCRLPAEMQAVVPSAGLGLAQCGTVGYCTVSFRVSGLKWRGLRAACASRRLRPHAPGKTHTATPNRTGDTAHRNKCTGAMVANRAVLRAVAAGGLTMVTIVGGTALITGASMAVVKAITDRRMVSSAGSPWAPLRLLGTAVQCRPAGDATAPRPAVNASLQAQHQVPCRICETKKRVVCEVCEGERCMWCCPTQRSA